MIDLIYSIISGEEAWQIRDHRYPWLCQSIFGSEFITVRPVPPHVDMLRYRNFTSNPTFVYPVKYPFVRSSIASPTPRFSRWSRASGLSLEQGRQAAMMIDASYEHGET
ncbi:hypothetical protein BDR03DRAFT_374984 [Suillus americanus]|nr:hypothetical protein BDR03DRAFT_374984 [Suillus americanus]